MNRNTRSAHAWPFRGSVRLVFVLGIVAAVSSAAKGEPPAPRIKADGSVLKFDWDAIRIGVAEYEEGPTGVTVFHFPKRVTAAVDVRGGGPSASGTDVLRLGYDHPYVDAVVIAGGSSYGLEAADGVRAELLASGKNGTDFFRVATVPAAIVYDFVGRDTKVYPDKALGKTALLAARPGEFPRGRRGAGRSVTVGKYFGPSRLETAGQGGAFREVGPTKIAVFTVVNAVGAIVGRDGQVVRGNRDPKTGKRTHVGDDLVRRVEAETKKPANTESGAPAVRSRLGENTTITLVAINQKVSYWQLQRLAVQVHTSMARAIEPFHATNDGDILFAVSTSEIDNPDLNTMDMCTLAADLAWDAVLASIPK